MDIPGIIGGRSGRTNAPGTGAGQPVQTSRLRPLNLSDAETQRSRQGHCLGQKGSGDSVDSPNAEVEAGLYHMANHRNGEQLAEMRRLEEQGMCLFCPGGLAANSSNQVLHQTEWWTVMRNRYPYANTRLHLLLVPAAHVSDVADLPLEAKAEFWDVLDWAKERHSLSFYGLGVRCGEPAFTGGTIRHVHLHLLVGDVADPSHEPVRMKFSSPGL